MSYDLFFDLTQSLAVEDVKGFFRKRNNYRFERAAIYENPATGVYFSFDLAADKLNKQAIRNVTFTLNYFRPHFFALEAEPEVCAFVEHFSPAIEDPQIDGMGTGPYSSQKFLQGWNKGNTFAYAAIPGESPDAKYLSLPEDTLETIWR